MSERVYGPASYFPSIEKKYSRPIDHWLELIEKSELTGHRALVDWLKADHGLGHGHANALVAYARARRDGTADTTVADITVADTAMGDTAMGDTAVGDTAVAKDEPRTGQGGGIRFRAVVRLNGRTATGIEVPEQIVERLGAGRRPKVRVTVNGHTYRSSIGSMRGTFMLPVSAEQRAKAGVEAGDEVDVELEPDAAPREVTVPPDLDAALDATARRFFDGLSYSDRRWYVLWIEGAKRAETRERRVAEAVAMLREGRKRR